MNEYNVKGSKFDNIDCLATLSVKSMTQIKDAGHQEQFIEWLRNLADDFEKDWESYTEKRFTAKFYR